MNESSLGHRFDYHQPTSDAIISQHADTRERCKRLALFIDQVIPDSREKSLALTSLEETMFWTNAGIARINNYQAHSQETDARPSGE